MKKRDRAIVAVILAAALVVGLALVSRALDRAAQAQTASLASAQFNGGGEKAASGEGTQAPTSGASSSSQESEEEETGAAFSGEMETGGEEETSASEMSQTAQGTEREEAPAAGGGAMTLAELSDWMERESSGALAAQNMGAAEAALAAGVGTADDALRRTFAQSQAEGNDQARRNQLAEEAAALGLEYLKCRDLLALWEEAAAFFRELEAAVEDKAGTDGNTGGEEIRLADLETVRQARTGAEEAAAEAEAELRAAVENLNAALGNPYGTELQVTDELSAQAMPSLSGDEAAVLALESRNEIKGADYSLERERQTLTQLRYTYAPNSPEVLEQQAVVSQAQGECTRAAGQVEADVRERLSSLEGQKQELEALAAALEQTGSSAPEPAYALEEGEEGAWSSNLAALMEQWTAIAENREGQIRGIAQFNLDVLCFQHAIGAGCIAVTI